MPSLKLSRLVPVGSKVKDGVIGCHVGDVIKIRADLVNRRGKARLEGHDDVIAWMVEVRQEGKGARAGGQVVDLRNGSYEVTFRCLWPGSTSKVSGGTFLWSTKD